MWFRSSTKTSSSKHKTLPEDECHKVLNSLDINVCDTIKQCENINVSQNADLQSSMKNVHEEFSPKTLPRYHGTFRYKAHSVQLEANLIGQYQVISNNNNNYTKKNIDLDSDKMNDEGIGSAESLLSQQSEQENINSLEDWKYSKSQTI